MFRDSQINSWLLKCKNMIFFHLFNWSWLYFLSQSNRSKLLTKALRAVKNQFDDCLNQNMSIYIVICESWYIISFKGVTLQKVKMAAIIAQMTRANRERKKNKCFEIVIGKCMYEIGPFPEKYEPEVNKFYGIS